MKKKPQLNLQCNDHNLMIRQASDAIYKHKHVISGLNEEVDRRNPSDK